MEKNKAKLQLCLEETAHGKSVNGLGRHYSEKQPMAKHNYEGAGDFHISDSRSCSQDNHFLDMQ